MSVKEKGTKPEVVVESVVFGEVVVTSVFPQLVILPINPTIVATITSAIGSK
jgi:hypothetical protein